MELVFGTNLTCKGTGERFIVLRQEHGLTHYKNDQRSGSCLTSDVYDLFDVTPRPDLEPTAPLSALDVQEGGDHYKKLGAYQPWEVLRAWMTPEEFRGYMKGTAIAYLAREQDKGADLDVKKAVHTLQGLVELGFDHGR